MEENDLTILFGRNLKAARVKRNIKDLDTVVDPLEFLNNVKGYQFQWRPESRIGDPTKFHYGFKVDDFRDNLINAGHNPSLNQQKIRHHFYLSLI